MFHYKREFEAPQSTGWSSPVVRDSPSVIQTSQPRITTRHAVEAGAHRAPELEQFVKKSPETRRRSARRGGIASWQHPGPRHPRATTNNCGTTVPWQTIDVSGTRVQTAAVCLRSRTSSFQPRPPHPGGIRSKEPNELGQRFAPLGQRQPKSWPARCKALRPRFQNLGSFSTHPRSR